MAAVRRSSSRNRCRLNPWGDDLPDSQSITARSVRPSSRANVERGIDNARRSDATGLPDCRALARVTPAARLARRLWERSRFRWASVGIDGNLQANYRLPVPRSQEVLHEELHTTPGGGGGGNLSALGVLDSQAACVGGKIFADVGSARMSSISRTSVA